MDFAHRLGAMLRDYDEWRDSGGVRGPIRRRRRGSAGDDSFFAVITGYEEVKQGESVTGLKYAWEEIEGDREGNEAIDLYDGRLALIDQIVFMSHGSDDVYRFMWRESFLAELKACDETYTAYVIDPTDATREVEVERVAGFYIIGDTVMIAPCMIRSDPPASPVPPKWTIVDRIPMIMNEPLEGEYSGVGGNTAADFQDEPTPLGCETEEEA